MNGINFWNGSKWLVIEKNFFKGVYKLEEVDSIFKVTSEKIEVKYITGKIVYYSNSQGTWKKIK